MLHNPSKIGMLMVPVCNKCNPVIRDRWKAKIFLHFRLIRHHIYLPTPTAATWAANFWRSKNMSEEKNKNRAPSQFFHCSLQLLVPETDARKPAVRGLNLKNWKWVLETDRAQERISWAALRLATRPSAARMAHDPPFIITYTSSSVESSLITSHDQCVILKVEN